VRPWPGPLGPGATVALVAPAYALTPEAAEEAQAGLAALGLRVRPGRHLAARDGPWAGGVAERVADLAWALTAPDVDGVWAARGGAGTLAVAGALPWRRVAARPRPVVGMSDITALHAGLARWGIPSLHAPMPGGGAGGGWDAWAAGAALAALSAPPPWSVPRPPDAPPPEAWAGGRAEGPVVGGNLTLLAACAGTPLQPPTGGAILFLEEVGEAAYRVDRALTQLALAGMLAGVAGVAVGAFLRCPPSGGVDVEEVLRRHLLPLGVPVLARLPVGHGEARAPLPLGVRARLDAERGELVVLEAPWGAAAA
jgi:muramoyltetrapeptide carboxypeptidase